MLTLNILIVFCFAYVVFLFGVAWWSEKRALAGRLGWLRSPLIYTFSISVYCTAWTFYGAVGSAARNGLEFVAIYLGPTLVFIGWWWLLRKIVRIGQTQRITSIADMISSRYGKSARLAVAVTLIAVFGTTPYIALQLQSITLSFAVFSGVEAVENFGGSNTIAIFVAIGLAVFTVLFGTRNIDVNERHHGVVSAIAIEAVVKLCALLAVGVFVVWGVANGPSDIFSRMPEGMLHTEQLFSPRWVTLTFLSATAIICLPRMFQVTVVELSDERHLATASWAFPLYLFAMSLFVLPIAIAGQSMLPADANPDLYVLSIPLAEGNNGIAMFAFLGGFSSATSMVIVAAIALSTMVSNHIVVPLWLRFANIQMAEGANVRTIVLLSRRLSIVGILALGYFYFRLTGGSGALASIGLIAFAGVAQVLPSLLCGLFWRGATMGGAVWGLIAGFIVWAYTLFIPSFEGGFVLSQSAIENGPFGVGWLRPQALLGLEFSDPLVHSIFWSMFINTALLVGVSLRGMPRPLERLQAAQFVDVFALLPSELGDSVQRRQTTSEDLYQLAERILGSEASNALFSTIAERQGRVGRMPIPTDSLIQRLERELAGSVGAASAHAMINQVAGGGTVSVEELMRIVDETARVREYSAQLEKQSEELERSAAKLRVANERLMELGAEKDAFLSKVSHELRTPMTSIRSFSEILRTEKDLSSAQAQRFVSIILEESQRLTRLLDEILDLSFLESGKVNWQITDVSLADVIDRALASTEAIRKDRGVRVEVSGVSPETRVQAEFDRLAQVFINLISNAVKYGQAEEPEIRITARAFANTMIIGVADNGPGIPEKDRDRVFEKFSRLSSDAMSGSAGLGLPISREIMRNLHGELTAEANNPGAVFRITIPLA